MTVPTRPLPVVPPLLLLLPLLLLSLHDGAAAVSGPSHNAQSPNFLVVMTDDCDMLTLQGVHVCCRKD